jgi:hypothetical protein
MTIVDDLAHAAGTGTAHRRGPAVPSTWHRPLTWFAGAMAVWAVISAVGLVIDPRTLAGDPIWAKPLKFTVSLILYAVTLAWMLSLVERPRLRRAGWWAGTIGAAASLVEIVVISIQVVRGTSSHFNVSTPLDAGLYAVMGSGAVIMYSATLVIGTALAFFTALPDRGLRWALRLGLIIGMAGLSVGFLMVMPTAQQMAQAVPHTIGSHSVGGDDTAGGLFLVGWNTTHGDLRVAHFVGMHALQILPLLAVLLGTIAQGRLSQTDRVRLVLLGAATWAALTVLVLWQALRGQSLVHPDTATWTVAAALTISLIAVTTGVLVHVRRHLAVTGPVAPGVGVTRQAPCDCEHG